MKYQYCTFDNVTYEKIYHHDFDDLKMYLDVYKDRLNEENEKENYTYKLHNELDAFEVCEVCNIMIRKQ